MIRVRFVGADGGASDAVAAEGARLLDVAQAQGLPLEGTCDGDMACATCHVVVAPADFARLPAASEEDEDLLDLAPCARATSRLACQVRLTPALDGMTVHVPG